MKFTALQNISAVASVLVASSAFASMTLTVSNTIATGVYIQSPTIWSIQFTFDGDLTQSSMDGEFGSWTLTVTGSNGDSWSKSNNETDGGSFINIGAVRIYSVDIGSGDGGMGGTPPVNPAPSMLSLRYTTTSTEMTLGQALDYSALNTTPDPQKGILGVTHVNGEGFVDGEIWGPYAVPAPGSVALLGLAGLVARRRRRN